MTELILFNANVVTMDPGYPRAKAVCVKNGKILAVGENEILEQHINTNMKAIDCGGHTILPGFNDAHCHFISYAESLTCCSFNPKEVHSISDIRDKIRTFAQTLPSGTWIRARAYDEYYLDERRHPTRLDLDDATSTHPVKLTHRSGHASVLNSLAMKIVGISTGTPEPPGAIIERDIHTGEPNGILFEMGSYLSKIIPPMSEEHQERGVRLASQQILSFGITSIQDASPQNDINRWQLLRHWETLGELKCRVTMMLGFEAFNLCRQQDFFNAFINDQIHISGVKIIVNETTGQLYPSQSELNEMVLEIHKSGLQAVIHAIENSSIEAACTAIEYALQRSLRLDHRHRVEHCSVCSPHLCKRLASLGVMVVTQPPFIYYNGDRYLENVPGSQLKYLYPLATLLEHSVHIAASSDCPLVPPNPLIGVYSAVSRRSETGKLILAQEGIAPLDALHMYTDYAARATFEENIKGAITPGKFADLVVLSNDPTRCPTEEIKNIQVEMTVLNGEVVWDKNGLNNNPSLDV